MPFSLANIEAILGEAKVAFTDAVTLFKAAPAVIAGIQQKRPVLEVLKEDAPEALAVVESLANLAFPGAGEAIQLIATLLAHSHPMTREEEETWFQRADGSGITDGLGNKTDSF